MATSQRRRIAGHLTTIVAYASNREVYRRPPGTRELSCGAEATASPPNLHSLNLHSLNLHSLNLHSLNLHSLNLHSPSPTPEPWPL
jgi:hypothetical protein